MEEVYLNRLIEEPEQTLGELVYKGQVIAKTLELPWLNNARFISCIQTGRYRTIRHSSPNYPKSFWLQNVPGRFEILIHHGNYNRNTRGCILVGRTWKDIDGDGLRDVTYSKPTMGKLHKMLPKEFTLVVQNKLR